MAKKRTPRYRTTTGIDNPNWKPGRPRKICGADKGPDKGICGLAAGYRTDHPGFGACIFHMGNTPAVAMGAFREQARELGRSFAPENLPDVDPISALLAEVSRTAGHVAWLQEKIGLWTMDTELEVPAHQRGWLQIYQAERRHLSNVAETAIRAGVAKRQVEIAEAQGAMLAEAVRTILDSLGLTPEQKTLVPSIVPQVLRAIAVRVDPASA